MHRSAHNQQHISPSHKCSRSFQIRHRLPEEDNVWPELGFPRSSDFPHLNSPVANIHHVLSRKTIPFATAILRTDLREFPVQMKHLAAPGSLVQIVHILCHHIHIEILLQLSQYLMGIIGFHIPELGPANIEKFLNLFRMMPPRLCGANLFHRYIVP